MKTILYMTHLYGKLVFVDALCYAGRSSLEIQHALLSHVYMSATPIGNLYYTIIILQVFYRPGHVFHTIFCKWYRLPTCTCIVS